MKRTGLFVLLALVISNVASAQHQTIDERQNDAAKNIVLLNNSNKIIPLKSLAYRHIAVISDQREKLFDSILLKYTAADFFTLTNNSGLNDLNDRLKLYDLIILRLSPAIKPDSTLVQFIKEKSAILILSGKEYRLKQFSAIQSPVIWCPDDTPEGASVAAQLVFGGVSCNNKLKNGKGYAAVKTRLGYTVTGSVFINKDSVNDIMAEAIREKATPGGVVLVVKDGRVIFEQAYGHQTYTGTRAVHSDDLYDLASVTKIAATSQIVMRLYDQGRLKLDDYVSKYVARTREITDKSTLRIREALLHEAGYIPYIKYFEQLKPSDLSTDSSTQYPVKVADNYFLRAHYFEEVMWPKTLLSPVLTRGKFVYSDVSMYMMREVVEKITHQKMNQYLLDSIYLPLGLQTMGYLPRNRFDSTRIVPTTESDSWFRKMQLRGYAHDPGAAMAGGVSGHAGLFSDANDLAILFQMFLNKGEYGGMRYLKPSTVTLFTSRQSKVSDRGLGFARPDSLMYQSVKGVSGLSYGHSGYTGTYIWADPAINMICIILTNRVYPDEINNGNKLQRLNTRMRILNQVYRSINK